MGKFSKALEKAGLNDRLQPETQKNAETEIERINLQVQEKENHKIEEHQDKIKPEVQTIKKDLDCGVPLSGVSGRWDERLFKGVSENKYLSEVVKTLRSKILYPKDEAKSIRTLMVASAIPKDGKSFVAANLAISFAQGLDQHALLVDCDLRKPTLGKLFGMNTSAGLVDYLQEKKAIASLIQKTSLNKLSLLGSGTPPLNPAELLSSSRMRALVQELSSRYNDRIIIFDSPPVLVASEARVLAAHVDGVVLVVRQRKASKAQVQTAIDALGSEKIIGFVFNDYKTNVFDRSHMDGYGYYESKNHQVT